MSKNVAISMKSEGLVLSGYQKKLKTMKKKYFVLYKETCSSIARLEYYDSEKKFKQGLEPKRVIKLKNCFNINRRLDTKYAFVLALSTTDGGFGIVLDTESDLQKWMDVLLSLQQSSTMSDFIYPVFEHVWQVNIQKKGIAEEKGVVGYYHVCLTSKSLTLISFRPEKTLTGDKRVPNVEFLLTTIRRCGDSHCFFYMEVGRQSVLGPGELWMETKDVLIAQNMHKMILGAMSAKIDLNLDVNTVNQAVKIESIVEPMRKRSSSATEASKPMSFFPKLQLSTDIKNTSQSTLHHLGRERCDSLPTRNRISNECSNLSSRSTRSNTISGPRPYSYQKLCSSPPLNTQIASKSEESSIFIDEPGDIGTGLPYRLHSRSKDGVIPEENTDEINVVEVKTDDLNKRKDGSQDIYISMAPVKTVTHCFDLNEWQHPPNQSRSLGESKRTSSLLMVNSETPGLHFEFPEHISEKVPRNSEIKIDCEYQRQN